MTRMSFVGVKDCQPRRPGSQMGDPGVQAEVLRVWKLNEARRFAEKRAEDLKKEAAANSGKSFKELASAKKKDFEIVIPPPFSYEVVIRPEVSYMPPRRQLGKVQGLEKIDEDFMKKVFKLGPNEVKYRG